MAHFLRQLRGRKGKRVMITYAPGNGSLLLAWRDDKDQGSGPKITRSMALRYLRENADAKHLREKGYGVWRPHKYAQWGLVSPIERIDDHTLKVDGKPVTYTLDDPDNCLPDNRNEPMVYRALIKARADIEAGDRIVNVEVKNWSMLSAMCYFLANEQALKDNPPVR